ncbi:hypothetical protein H7F15_15665 [Pontibacter sp. Tf4]|uniref:hypothetical protein n=1 Tax=Pontibacter sp. Tf4 TaxID=2761620 RepID=UPI0016247AC1|nr:hypothetical protein [Pontibacter sp. Tf4]MBB6612482.1 hypothetical protein [Pontibacter sp. Tf4]
MKTRNIFALAIVGILLFACQPTEQQQETTVANPQQPAITIDTTQRRPAPDFYVIAPGTERKRVWVCDDQRSDVFHVDNRCEVLLTCTGVYKNVSLQRAVEEYDRYHCETCSQEYADMFDQDKVRYDF